MTEFKKRIALNATPLLIMSLAMFLPSITEASVIKDLRIGSNDGYVRMVFESDRPLTPPPAFSMKRNTLRATLFGGATDLSAPGPGEYRRDVASIHVSREAQKTRIDVVFLFEPADVKAFFLTDPHRFVIDAYRPVSSNAPPLPVEKAGPVPSIGEEVSFPPPSGEPEKPAPPQVSGPIHEPPARVMAPAVPSGGSAADPHRSRFRQRLITALLAVTTIILVLLFFLIWMGKGRKKSQKPSWADHLPTTKNRNIENIDSMIRGHLKDFDHP